MLHHISYELARTKMAVRDPGKPGPMRLVRALRRPRR